MNEEDDLECCESCQNWAESGFCDIMECNKDGQDWCCDYEYAEFSGRGVIKSPYIYTIPPNHRAVQ